MMNIRRLSQTERSANPRVAAALIVPMMLLFAACPKDNTAKRDTMVVDTTHLDTTTATDLSNIHSNLPAAEPDTFKQRKLTPAPSSGGSTLSVPAAPSELMEAVQREQSMTKFCYTEFGQKNDPTLRGNVAMVVTVAAEGIVNATVGDARWSGAAGKAVNSCLNQKAKLAWKLAPGAVKSGKYVVQLSFSGA